MLDALGDLRLDELDVVRVYDLSSVVRLFPARELVNRFKKDAAEVVLDARRRFERLRGRVVWKEVAPIRWYLSAASS